ncbi:ABC transporter permease [Bacillus fonticola]|uniref:ABC transporter permease n=1 Tax=Bacillus fonticola TaxID=2728853 RepID=UPI0014728243|nr:proline/glycine betaine ABC transporter permease [Bacillus fonticola]
MTWLNEPLFDLQVGQYVDRAVDSIYAQLGPAFEAFTTGMEWLVEDIFTNILFNYIPVYVLILLVAGLAYLFSRNIGLPIFTIVGLLFIHNIGYWEEMIQTLSIVLASVLLSIILGVPLGILASQSELFSKITTPVLDFMQTMPSFVYLIPTIIFFGSGVVPGIVSSVVFAMPPTIRLTNLGIRQVSEDLVEAANAFGSTRNQKLFKVQIPLAKGTIMAGVNQSIMLSLSMVVIAALVGAPGLGTEVVRAVAQIDVAVGFEAGVSIVILAIILDRITQSFQGKKEKV